MKMHYSKLTWALLFTTIWLSCHRDDLHFNPHIDDASSAAEILATQSYFDRRDHTFVITEKEYAQLIVDRSEAQITFTDSEIWDDISSYSYITYPYFSEDPDLFFMGSIEEIEQSNGQITIILGDAEYEDLYEHYLINSDRPNDISSTRASCAIDLHTVYSLAESPLNSALGVLGGAMTDLLAINQDSTFFDEYDISIQMRGDMQGCLSYYNTNTVYGVVIEDFELQNFGLEVAFARPDADFAKLKVDLQDNVFDEYLNLANQMAEFISGLIVTSDKSLQSVSGNVLGTRVSILGGLEQSFSGDFTFDNIYEVNTTAPLKIEIEVSKTTGAYTYSINGIPNAEFNNHLITLGDSYMAAKAEYIVEFLGGLSFGDLAGKAEIGLLLGRRHNYGLRGQVGRFYDNNGIGTDYFNGCASYTITDHAYFYTEIQSINEFFEDFLELEVPNTLELGEWPVYNIAQDPNFQDQSASISYTSICHPDNCLSIDEGNSYVEILEITGDQITFTYLINTNSADVGTFEVILDYPTAQETIVANGEYGIKDTLTANIDNSGMLTALLNQDQVNTSIIVKDLFNDCEKQFSEIFFDINCSQEIFDDTNSDLKLRAYNINLSGDQLSGCESADDPVWVFQNATLAELYSFDEGYSSFNYMSYDNCECYATQLSNSDITYSIPTHADIQSFISQTVGIDYTMSGGNMFCSNFVQTGYIIVGSDLVCNNSWSSNVIVGLTTDYCINEFDHSYFFVQTPSDLPQEVQEANNYLFKLSDTGAKSILATPAGVLAPCRLKIN